MMATSGTIASPSREAISREPTRPTDAVVHRADEQAQRVERGADDGDRRDERDRDVRVEGAEQDL